VTKVLVYLNRVIRTGLPIDYCLRNMQIANVNYVTVL